LPGVTTPGVTTPVAVAADSGVVCDSGADMGAAAYLCAEEIGLGLGLGLGLGPGKA
jgi:hypothetical protein